MKKLSVIILTRNEEKEIGDCIDSVSFADEILIIDDNSTDKTCEIAKGKRATVYQHKRVDFASSRNVGLELAIGQWILFLDADERVSPALASEIQSIVQSA